MTQESTIKIKYFIRSLMNIRQPKECPYCASSEYAIADTKYFVSKLLKCKNCHLNYRFPKDTPEFLNKFYQEDYSIECQMITKLPSDVELEKLKKENFPSLRDYSVCLNALNAPAQSTVIDYGCSWGYSLFQLKNGGFDVQGYELSKSRAEYGKKLDVEIITTEENIRSGNDYLINAHVIEHLSDIKTLIKTASSKLKEDGIMLTYCPNGSIEYQKRNPYVHHVNWGFLHPNFLDVEFAQFLFKDNPYLILTGDWVYNQDIISKWDKKSQVVGPTRDGIELLIISKPNILLIEDKYRYSTK
jgi:hypothetical protein